jgi:hypothetical protein
MDPTLTTNQIISAFGGTAAIAQLCEVSPAAVSQWRSNGLPQRFSACLAAFFDLNVVSATLTLRIFIVATLFI